MFESSEKSRKRHDYTYTLQKELAMRKIITLKILKQSPPPKNVNRHFKMDKNLPMSFIIREKWINTCLSFGLLTFVIAKKGCFV